MPYSNQVSKKLKPYIVNPISHQSRESDMHQFLFAYSVSWNQYTCKASLPFCKQKGLELCRGIHLVLSILPFVRYFSSCLCTSVNSSTLILYCLGLGGYRFFPIRWIQWVNLQWVGTPLSLANTSWYSSQSLDQRVYSMGLWLPWAPTIP